MIDKNTKHFHPIFWNSYDLLRRIQICLPSKRKLFNDIDKYEPVFIVGSGRSGNTLLRRILNASNEIYIPPEMKMLNHIISIYHRYSNAPWNELVNLIYSS